MFDRIRAWIGSQVLEIGSGIGNLSAFLVDRARLVLTDTREEYLARLRTRFANHSNISVAHLYLPEDDITSLAAVRKLLEPKGRLVLLVPALPALYGSIDRALGHHRRYTSADLIAKLERTGFRLAHIEYFNLAGIPGWWWAGRVLQRQTIPAGSLKLYDTLVPLFRLERLIPWRVGQSLIAVGEAA